MLPTVITFDESELQEFICIAKEDYDVELSADAAKEEAERLMYFSWAMLQEPVAQAPP